MLIEKFQHFLRIAAEPIVSVFETLYRTFDPVHLLVFAGQHIKRTLGIVRILDDGIVLDLPNQKRQLEIVYDDTKLSCQM